MLNGDVMKKKLIFVFAFMLIVSLSLSACGTGKTELQTSVEQLNEQIEQLNREISGLKQKAETSDRLSSELEELNERLQELDQRLQALEEQSALYQAQIENLAGEEIEYTAKAPIFAPKKGAVIIQSVNNRDHMENDDYSAFADFYAYYQREIEGKYGLNFYLVDPNDHETGWIGHFRDKEFIFSAEQADGENLTQPMLYERLSIYDEVLKQYPGYEYEGSGLAGGANYSIDMKLYLMPFPEEIIKDQIIRLEFGNNSSYGTDEYFNLYLEGTCVGTCYFKRSCYISKTWLTKFFKRNYIKNRNVLQ